VENIHVSTTISQQHYVETPGLSWLAFTKSRADLPTMEAITLTQIATERNHSGRYAGEKHDIDKLGIVVQRQEPVDSPNTSPFSARRYIEDACTDLRY